MLLSGLLLCVTTVGVCADDDQLSSNPHPNMFPTGISLFAPVGFGADLGVVYGGFSWVNRWPGDARNDGNIVLGSGLGKGNESIGFDVSLLLDDIGFQNTRFADSGAFGAKFFRWITPNVSVALGAASIGQWGSMRAYSNSWYGSMTDYFSPFAGGRFPMAVTFGVGTGAFFSESDSNSNVDSQIKPFGSLALSVSPNLSVIADYTADMWSSGVSVVPLLQWPIAITAYASNLGGGLKKSGPVTYGVRLSMGWVFV